MKNGRCGTMTHDYKRNGTTTLFAALNVLDGSVIGRCMQRHRHEEFIRFLHVTEAAVAKGQAIHAIVDNYATHKHPKVREWLTRHPRWTFHFTPTSASWLNAVEGYFAKLTKRRLKRGAFRSVVELQAAIKRFLAETNADPRPFRWTKDPAKIIAAVKRGHQVLELYPLGSNSIYDPAHGPQKAGIAVRKPAIARPKLFLRHHSLLGAAMWDRSSVLLEKSHLTLGRLALCRSRCHLGL